MSFFPRPSETRTEDVAALALAVLRQLAIQLSGRLGSWGSCQVGGLTNNNYAKGKDGIDASGFGGTILEYTETPGNGARSFSAKHATERLYLCSSWVDNNLRGWLLCMGSMDH